MGFITKLTFAEKVHEDNDIYTFSFTANRPIQHKAGQHGLFVLPGLYRPHPLSLSSSPDEPYISFTTHTATGSAFKNKLLALKPGDPMIFLGPVLNFTFTDTATKYVFLAQGIGVTPFRSMLKYAFTIQLPITTTLIHVDSTQHSFEKLTKQYASTALYPTSADEFKTLLMQQDVTSLFYISGSPRFVSSTKHALRDMGVANKAIKTDSFLGY
jgi:ferredoxin-NADP reductase